MAPQATYAKIDENLVNYVYNRYISMLQVDKNASIETILREPAVMEQIQQQLQIGPQGQVMGFTEMDLQQAVIDKLYQEEETQDIQ